MTTRKLAKCIVVGSLTACSFSAGTYLERKQYFKASNEIQLANLPALPLFGTVSAASPFTPIQAPQVETNVSRVSQIMKYGFPGMDQVRSFDDFVLSYDRRNRVAHWVFEHLTADNVRTNDGVDRSKCEFKPDESIHKFFRSDNEDYKKSGYDRGHLAAAGNHKSHQHHVEQTFYLSNMAPQVGKGFNRDSWNRLEKYVRKLTKVYKNVYCCTGPLYLPSYLQWRGRSTLLDVETNVPNLPVLESPSLSKVKFSVQGKSRPQKKVISSSSKLEKSAELYSQSTEQMALAVNKMAIAISNLAEAISKIADSLKGFEKV